MGVMVRVGAGKARQAGERQTHYVPRGAGKHPTWSDSPLITTASVAPTPKAPRLPHVSRQQGGERQQGHAQGHSGLVQR